MYLTLTEWRKEIRASEKALKLMKSAADTRVTNLSGVGWRRDLASAIRELEQTIASEWRSYDSEKKLIKSAEPAAKNPALARLFNELGDAK